MRIAVTGASGLIGTALRADLAEAGHEVIKLVRRAATGPGELCWNPLAGDGGLDPGALSGVDAVVHLAGAPIAAKRWTAARKHLLLNSRLASTKALVTAMTAAEPRPAALLCASAIGWYGDRGNRLVDESDPAGQGFLPGMVRDWEAAARVAEPAGIRVISLRTGIVLAANGGMLGRLLPLFRLGLGAKIGSGRQYLSWISLHDEAAAIRFLLEHTAVTGPVNLTAPEPVTNADFTAALAAALARPALLALPAPVLRVALGEVAADLLASARIRPAKLLDAGFVFRHPDIKTALADILARPART